VRTSPPPNLILNLQFEKIDRLIKVRKNYLEMIETDSATFKLIDSTNPLDQVIDEIYDIITDIMIMSE
jgi:thymidylate kinase